MTGWWRGRGLRATRLAAIAAAVTSFAVLTPAQVAPRRIVSIIPAITEMLFAIGAGPRVVGVGSFDSHPPEIDRVTRVGGLIDPDLERILSLKPDLVAVYASQADLRQQLARAGIPVFVYAHGGLDAVMETIRQLGSRVGPSDEAGRLADALARDLAGVRARVKGRDAPLTLLVFDREPASLRNIYASGGVGFLHDVLTAAGGRNVLADIDRESMQISPETILTRAPEVIVELRNDREAPADVDRELRPWTRLASVPAVRSERVILLFGSDLLIPGPRIARATERLARALHPDAFRP